MHQQHHQQLLPQPSLPTPQLHPQSLLLLCHHTHSLYSNLPPTNSSPTPHLNEVGSN